MKRKTISLGLALMLMLSLCLVTAIPAAADVVPVGPTPNYTTIQAAIDAANPYDTILVKAGDYYEDVNVYKPLTILSEEGYEETAIIGISTGYTGAVVIDSDDVVLGAEDQGFYVGGVGQAGVYFKAGCDNATVEGNFVMSAEGKNALVTEGGQSDHTIKGNVFVGNASQLVYVNGQASVSVPSSNVDFIGNAFGGTLNGGVALGQEATNSEIIDNYFGSICSYAILEFWATGCTVGDNIFDGDLPGDGRYVLDNTDTYDMDEILADNDFLRAALVEHPGSSRLPAIWANIQGAVNAAVAGDTVDVIVGTYRENVVITADKDDLELRGAGWANTLIYPASGQPIKLPGWSMLAERPLDGVRIHGFTLMTADDSHAILVGSGTPDGDYYTTNLSMDGIMISGGSRGIGLNSVNGAMLTNVRLSNVSGSPEAALELTGVCNLHFILGAFSENDIGVRLQPTGSGDIGEGYGPNGNINIHGSTFCDNGIAIENQDTSVEIDATNNYWCHPSGPSHSPGYGDRIIGYIAYEPWLLVSDGENYDKTLCLKDGWTLFSIDKTAENVDWAGDVVLTYKFIDGHFESTTIDELYPLTSIFVKTVGGAGVGIDYPEEDTPDVDSKNLQAGWNLIGSPAGVGTKALLASVRYVTVGTDQIVGLTSLVSPGEYTLTGADWQKVTLTEFQWTAPFPTIDPFDGCWASMEADDVLELPH